MHLLIQWKKADKLAYKHSSFARVRCYNAAQDVHAAFMAALGSAYARVISYREFVMKADTDE